MSDERITRLLERVARECADTGADAQVRDIKRVLEARIGPLLRAGQAMHDWSATTSKSITAWEEALAALEGRDGK